MRGCFGPQLAYGVETGGVSGLPEGRKVSIDPDLFVSKGLLPENLPPVFTSQALVSAFSGLGPGYAVTRNVVGAHALHNASKRGGQRRLFRIPHPIFIRDQALFLNGIGRR